MTFDRYIDDNSVSDLHVYQCMCLWCIYSLIMFFTFPCCYIELEINFAEIDYSITEGSPLHIEIQFQRTQIPFTLSLRAVSIASAEASGLGNFLPFATDYIDEDFRATGELMSTLYFKAQSTITSAWFRMELNFYSQMLISLI